MVVGAITLGSEIDILLRKFSVKDSLSMIIAQALTTIYIEEYLKDIKSSILEKQGNVFLKPRFAPGFGDFDIRYQDDIIKLLNTPINIGMTTTSAHMLVPSKSITFVLGLTDKSCNYKENKCEYCNFTDCEMRKL